MNRLGDTWSASSHIAPRWKELSCFGFILHLSLNNCFSVCLFYIYNLKQLLPADTPLKAYIFQYTEAQFQASSFPFLHLSDLNNASAYWSDKERMYFCWPLLSEVKYWSFHFVSEKILAMHSLISDPVFCYCTVIFFWATASSNASFFVGRPRYICGRQLPKGWVPFPDERLPSLVNKNIKVNYHQVRSTNLLTIWMQSGCWLLLLY